LTALITQTQTRSVLTAKLKSNIDDIIFEEFKFDPTNKTCLEIMAGHGNLTTHHVAKGMIVTTNDYDLNCKATFNRSAVELVQELGILNYDVIDIDAQNMTNAYHALVPTLLRLPLDKEVIILVTLLHALNPMYLRRAEYLREWGSTVSSITRYLKRLVDDAPNLQFLGLTCRDYVNLSRQKNPMLRVGIKVKRTLKNE